MWGKCAVRLLRLGFDFAGANRSKLAPKTFRPTLHRESLRPIECHEGLGRSARRPVSAAIRASSTSTCHRRQVRGESCHRRQVRGESCLPHALERIQVGCGSGWGWGGSGGGSGGGSLYLLHVLERIKKLLQLDRAVVRELSPHLNQHFREGGAADVGVH